MTPRSVTRHSALRESSSSRRICEVRTHSCASEVAPSLMPRGLSRTTSRANSTERPARWMALAKARAAVVLRIPCEPMKAIFALRGQDTCGCYSLHDMTTHRDRYPARVGALLWVQQTAWAELASTARLADTRRTRLTLGLGPHARHRGRPTPAHLRGLDHVGSVGGGDEPDRPRPDGRGQHLPQPGPDGQVGRHRRPHQRGAHLAGPGRRLVRVRAPRRRRRLRERLRAATRLARRSRQRRQPACWPGSPSPASRAPSTPSRTSSTIPCPSAARAACPS